MTAPVAFTRGWVRLTLRPCPHDPAYARAARLEVRGADRVLILSPGRRGGATAGLLSGTEAPARGDAQTFALPSGSERAREVVLAPWASASEPPRLSAVQLLAPAA